MVAEMLHVAPAAAAGLVELIEAHTAGNPYETLELLNALRRDGALLATPAGWRWDEAAVRAHLGQSEVAELLAARVEGMPAPARRLVEAMACLGGRAQPNLLEVATGEPAAAVEVMVEPALDDGVLVLEPGVHQAVQFGHDRIREVILRALDAQRRRVLQLGMARRLAGVPELFAVAAEQYLPVVDAVDDAAERAVVVRLLRRAADQARLIGDYTPVNALLAAALRLIDPAQTATLIEVHTDRHAALYSLGRLDEADEEYRAIEALRPTALQRADARCMQVRSLTIRNRFAEAIELGLDSLRELGVAVPAANRLAAELDDKLDRLHWWLDHTEAADDLARPDITDPTLLATAGLIDAIVPAAYFDDPSVHGWLNGEALGIWLDHGPTRTLLGPVSHVAMAVVTLRGDRAAAYRTMRRILTLGEARGYDPDTSQARHVFAHLAGWFEPIENGAHAAQQAREGLIAGANLAYAGYTYHEASYYLLDCAALDTHVAEIEAGLAFTWRTGSEQTAQWLEPYRRLAGVLRGESSAAAGDEVPIDSYADNPLALLVTHITRGIAAAVFSDPVGLTQHAAAAMPLLAGAPGLYETAIARLLRGLALAEQSRATGGDERRDLLSELEELARWLAARAADAPDNFLHLLRLLEAERAWALGDFRAAALAFDTARRDVAGRRRPWHQALITERAARFHLAHGLERAGYDLLTEARQEYLDWGATAKVSQLDWAYPALRPQGSDRTADLPDGRSGMTTGTIDLLGILSASQALSSETSIERLHARVAKILSEMTGATGVDLLLWSDDRQDWDIPEARSDGAVPMSVLRYVQRMPEPLVVSDATSDDRFARDPYFADLDCCSLLVVPILSRGTPRAVLLLENRLIRGAFSTERLDGAKLIAGQLAVSLDNAQLYAEFRRIADEQAALGRVATLVARGGPAAEVFEAVANEARRVLDLDGSSLIRFESDGSATLVAADTRLPLLLEIGEPLMLDASTTAAEVQRTAKPVRRDYAATAGPMSRELHRLGYRGSVGAPIVVEGRVWGVMLASWAAGRAIPPDSERRLVQFTELVATAVGNAHSRAELSASRARLVATADETRRRIERDLHDGAQQRLVSLALQVRAARAAVPPGVGAELDSVADGLTGALDELRELARGIHPAILTEGGLGRALRVLARRSSVPVELDAPSSSRLPEPVEVAAYYVVSEALTNAAKHANASAVTVSVKADDANHLLRVAVRDNGAGGANFTDGTGLVGLRDRVEALGGRILLESPQGAGTSLHVELPLTATNSGRLR
jgi:signal transduction histidine kinase